MLSHQKPKTTKFEKAIERNWPDYVITPGAAISCPNCFSDFTNEERAKLSYEDTQSWNEGSFSWHKCDSCNSTLGGDRFPAHAIHREAFGPKAKQPNNIHHIEICVDCLMFHANSDVPETWE